jgi:hypothetical protein
MSEGKWVVGGPRRELELAEGSKHAHSRRRRRVLPAPNCVPIARLFHFATVYLLLRLMGRSIDRHLRTMPPGALVTFVDACQCPYQLWRFISPGRSK